MSLSFLFCLYLVANGWAGCVRFLDLAGRAGFNFQAPPSVFAHAFIRRMHLYMNGTKVDRISRTAFPELMRFSRKLFRQINVIKRKGRKEREGNRKIKLLMFLVKHAYLCFYDCLAMWHNWNIFRNPLHIYLRYGKIFEVAKDYRTINLW